MSSLSLSIWDLSWLPSLVVTEHEMTCSPHSSAILASGL